MERAPIRKNAAVQGINRISPPSRFMSRPPVFSSIPLLPRKRSVLNMEWLIMW
ncbi:hypothetical protein BMS3Abin13_00968 [bacterium BMS3Abin13]|nr:hypothetical protein BMS3Abin13_00968 [bacterium BMS3Abin13]